MIPSPPGAGAVPPRRTTDDAASSVLVASSRNPRSRSVSPGAALPIPEGRWQGRRRNPATARAILTATLALLDDPAVGYRGLTMRAVAEGAGVSTATLYRWWPGKNHLVLDAYRSRSARDITPRVTGDLRTDLVAHLGHLAFTLNSPPEARTLAEIMLAAADDPAFGRLFRDTLLRERRQALLDMLAAAVERGDVSSSRDLGVAVDVAFGALHHRLLISGEPIDGPFVTALADIVIGGITRD
jgi:AcrR family transcriptional regulator